MWGIVLSRKAGPSRQIDELLPLSFDLECLSHETHVVYRDDRAIGVVTTSDRRYLQHRYIHIPRR